MFGFFLTYSQSVRAKKRKKVSRIYSGNYKYYIHQAIRGRSSQDSGILAEILAITHLRACMDFDREQFLVYHPSTSGHFVGASGDPSQRQGAGGADCRGSYFIYEPVQTSWEDLQICSVEYS